MDVEGPWPYSLEEIYGNVYVTLGVAGLRNWYYRELYKDLDITHEVNTWLIENRIYYPFRSEEDEILFRLRWA